MAQLKFEATTFSTVIRWQARWWRFNMSWQGGDQNKCACTHVRYMTLYYEYMHTHLILAWCDQWWWCTPLPTVEITDNADLNEVVTKLNLENEINDYITKLCKDVINFLRFGIMVMTDRTSLVEKCCIFYNRLLNIKFAGNFMGIDLAMPYITGIFDSVVSQHRIYVCGSPMQIEIKHYSIA